jgi:hypothetical protein
MGPVQIGGVMHARDLPRSASVGHYQKKFPKNFHTGEKNIHLWEIFLLTRMGRICQLTQVCRNIPTFLTQLLGRVPKSLKRLVFQALAGVTKNQRCVRKSLGPWWVGASKSRQSVVFSMGLGHDPSMNEALINIA